MQIRTKLFLAFGGVSLLAMGAGAIALFINTAVKADVAQIVQSSVEKPKAAEGMFESLLNLELHWQAAGRNPTEAGIPERSGAAVAQDLEHFEKYLGDCRKATTRGVELAVEEDDAQEIRTAKDEAELLTKIGEKFAAMKELLARQVTAPISATPLEGAFFAAWKLHYEEITTLVQNYKAGAQDQLSGEVRDVETSLSSASQVMLWSTVALLVVAGLLAWFISLAFARPLRLLAAAARDIGSGRLETTVAFDSKDEFGFLAKTFNRMTGSLQTTTVSRDYVDGILKSMANSLIVVKADRTIQTVNASTLRMLGYAESELVGQSMDLVLQIPGGNLQSILDDSGQHGLSDVELVYQTKTAVSVPISFSAAVLRDAAGTVTGIVCVAQDISERKRTEAELAQTHMELVRASRQAGMAEVATGVLHNVGNVLNSVNVTSTCLANGLKKSKSANLAKVVDLMRDHEGDLGAFLTTDPKGKLIPGYLAQLAEHLAAEQSAAIKELVQLQKNIEHIKDIVTMQQDFAKVSGVTEMVKASELVEEALKMNSSSLVRHEIQIVKDVAALPPFSVEKHKVLQILVNLIRNAKHACDDSGRTNKRMTVRVTNGDGSIKIAVSDNGVGIPPENMLRIFAHGFTTKKDGHGFGLHSGALAAKEMGGSLTASSDGPGCGARFTLELPARANSNDLCPTK